MKKIVVKWMLISLGMGMIPVVLLGPSPGGIALSPLILLFCFSVGLFGSAIHINILSFKLGSKEQKLQAVTFASFSILGIGLLVYNESRCELKQEYAIQRASKYINEKPELDIINLGGAVFDPKRCVCTFEYSSPEKAFTIFVTEYGELHFSSEKLGL